VVEDYQDVLAIESTNSYTGTYHILGGLISPINGIGPSQLNIASLLDRINNKPVEEVIIALNATPEGESTTFYLYKKIISVVEIKITTLAKGISVGEDLNYADEITLSRSILNRVPLSI
jgi:recombination protein RecR